MKMHEGLYGWSADSVAECLSYETPAAGPIYRRLWQLVGLDTTTLRGGDGSNGTTETTCDVCGAVTDDSGNFQRICEVCLDARDAREVAAVAAAAPA